MAGIQIAVMNASTVLKDQDVQAIVPDLQTQVQRDFMPAWGINADLIFVPSNARPPADAWWLTILDNSDQANALGYHDLTDQGLPLSKVFAASDLQAGYHWSVTASHELLEMLVDPDINLTVFVQPNSYTGTLYAYEVCDACEAEQYAYTICSTLVSDFVYPAWFESFRSPESTQFDFGRHIQQPLELLPGGYIGIFDVRSGTGWHQLSAHGNSAHARYLRALPGSRRERRRIPRDQWRLSTPHAPATSMM